MRADSYILITFWMMTGRDRSWRDALPFTHLSLLLNGEKKMVFVL